MVLKKPIILILTKMISFVEGKTKPAPTESRGFSISFRDALDTCTAAAVSAFDFDKNGKVTLEEVQ